jgi:dolichol-phosphate mannosyltransferase
MPRTIWLVLPTYNEAENIAAIVAGATRELARFAPDALRVLIVDDASPDGTGAIADRLAAEDPAVEVLHRIHRDGLGGAYVSGFERALAAGADLVVQMDADHSHDPADIPRLIAAVDAGADLALGSRYVAGGAVAHWGVLRRMISLGGCAYARAVLGVDVRDLTGGFKCWRRDALEAIELDTVRSHGYVFQIELTVRALRRGLSVVEVPITFHDRLHGHSKMSPSIAMEAAWLLPQLRSRERSVHAPTAERRY